jgi:hypothetical protein
MFESLTSVRHVTHSSLSSTSSIFGSGQLGFGHVVPVRALVVVVVVVVVVVAIVGVVAAIVEAVAEAVAAEAPAVADAFGLARR